jgi:hypothetical protein
MNEENVFITMFQCGVASAIAHQSVTFIAVFLAPLRTVAVAGIRFTEGSLTLGA